MVIFTNYHNHFRLNVSTLGTLRVLFPFLHAEDYLHTSSTLFKRQVQLSLAVGSGEEEHVMHAWLSWKNPTNSGACI